MKIVRVDLGERGYEVHIGKGVARDLATILDNLHPDASRVAIVTQDSIPHAVETGRDQKVFSIGQGELHKSMQTIEDLCSGFVDFGLTRGDVVIGVGGGMVTDVAGFAAAIYHRGVPVVHVATSLLAQVDAAIGGKTGVNLPQGKNLVGSFWQPTAVLCDTEMLATLPEPEWRSGLGEVAKYHFLGGEGMEVSELDEQVARCVRIKAEVVMSDERESGRRAILNYGHTLAHALETHGTYGLRHGEAVAVGVVYAAEVAYRLGRIGEDRLAEHRRIVEGLGLTWESEIDDPDAVLERFSMDKKAVGDVTMVLDGPRGVETVRGIDRGVLLDAMASLRPGSLSGSGESEPDT